MLCNFSAVYDFWDQGNRRIKIQNRHTHIGMNKGAWKKGNYQVFGCVFKGGKKAERRRNSGVYSKEAAVLLWPDTGLQPNLMLPWKTLHQLYNLAFALT